MSRKVILALVGISLVEVTRLEYIMLSVGDMRAYIRDEIYDIFRAHLCV